MATATGAPFPGRGLIIVVTFIVILVTLVLQGLTLRPLINVLGLGPDDVEEREEIEARLRTARAGVARLERLIEERPELAAAAQGLRERHRHRVHRYAERKQRRRHERDEREAAAYRAARDAMLDAEREELVRLRDAGVISDNVLRRIQHDLDLQQLLLAAEPALDDYDERRRAR